MFCVRENVVIIIPRPMVGALNDDARLRSVCRVHRGTSRTEMPRKTKLGTEVGHVTRDSDATFNVKRSRFNSQGAGHTVAASRTACFTSAFGVA